MSGYVWKGHGRRHGIYADDVEQQIARDKGPRHDNDAESEEDEPKTQRGPLSIAEVFGLKPT